MRSADQDGPVDGPAAIYFAPFCLDPRAGRLTCSGETIPLRPKTWAVLLYLAERPGELVTKEHLLDAVWPDVAVTPDTLTKSIGELRHALGDVSKTPRYIETVHRRGFRFMARVSARPPVAPGLEESAGPEPETRFVGRTAELQRLERLLAKAAAGERQLAFVTGGAGIGKSALVEAFLGSTAMRGGDVLVGRGTCVEQYGAREAYMPVLEALERLAQGAGATRLSTLLRRAAPTWLLQMPWLIGDDAQALRQTLSAARPERMLREFASLIEALSIQVTVVLVLEDLHWSDPSTVDLLSFLGQRREAARLLVLATHRSAESAGQKRLLAQAVQTLRLRRQCVQIRLHDLSLDEVNSYLEARFPGARFPPLLARRMREHTDGNPLFLVAATEHLVSRGWILDTAPGWALSVPVEKLDLGIPDEIRSLIETEIEALRPADRELLEAASVAAAVFAPQSVAGVLGCDPGDVERRCESLARAHRFLCAAGGIEWPDGSVARRYAFVHELYRRTVYDSIPDGQRRRLHRGIGETIETAYGARAVEVAPELSVHFEKSRDHARAIRHLAVAAGAARRRFANREALAFLDGALALAGRLPEAAARQRGELELRLLGAPILSDLHGFAAEPVRASCERAYDLCTRVGTAAERFQVLYGLCHIHSVRVDARLAPRFAAELKELARRLATPAYGILADSAALRMAATQGRFREACRLFERRLARADAGAVQSLPIYGADPLIAARAHYAFALWMLGHSDRARQAAAAALAVARSQDSPFTLTSALWFAAVLEVFGRNPANARPLVDEVVALSAEHGFAFWGAVATALHGAVQLQSGSAREAIETLARARAALASSRGRLFSTHILAFLAEAHLQSDAFDRGLAAVEEGLALAESTLDRTYGPELWRLKGELLSARTPRRPSEREEARRCLVRAVALARELEAKPLELRAAIRLARASPAAGRETQAYAALAEICAWFGSAAAGADLDDARALLERLPRSGPPRLAAARKVGPAQGNVSAKSTRRSRIRAAARR
jgi:DNA-binding winged helix-turn-helix (wHTH) protein